MEFVFSTISNKKLRLQILQPSDIENAELEWIMIAQKEFSSNKSYFNQLKFKFGVFFNNQNILLCGGRIKFSNLPENSKNPIFLPKQSHFSHLIILFSHVQIKHGGIKDTISQARSQYWIISITQLVKSIIKKCFLCQRLESKPY